MVLLKKGLTSKEKTEMLDQIKDVDGVKWALGMDSFVGAAFPDTMIPSNLKKMLESDEYEMEFICSKYKTATDEVNNQIDEIQKIVEEVVAANPQSVEDYKNGKEKAIGFLVGQTMKAMKGKADPASVNQMLKELL